MTKHIPVYTLLAALILSSGCGNKPPAGTSGLSGSNASTARAARANDYTIPALTEEKLTKFLASMDEPNNPLEFIFKTGGDLRNPLEMKAKEVELNAYARKYGFKDYVEYIDTWGRAMVGQMQLSSAKLMKGLAESTQKSIEEAEAKLKSPNLSPDERKTYTGQAEEGRKSLADMKKDSGTELNAADLALVEKFNDRIEAAAKKHRGQ